MVERNPFEGLPALLAEIAEVAGLEAALAIAEARGGSRTVFPARAPDGHWMVELIGREATDKLCAHFRSGGGGIELDVPMGPVAYYRKARRRLAQLVDEGVPVARAAHQIGLHLRTARRWRSRARQSDQGKFF
jgi:hypothetical protein